jgi:hypothetical protein
MSNERFIIFMSQYAVHVDSRTHKTFAEAWEQLNKIVTDMGNGTRLKRMYDTADECLKANPDGRVFGSLTQMWEFGRYEYPNTWGVDHLSKAFIMRLTFD